MTAPPGDATAHRIARMRALKPSGAYQALAYIAAARPGLADAALDFCDDTRLAEAVRAELGDLGNWKPAGLRNVSPAPEIVSGRSEPRPSGEPVAHVVRLYGQDGGAIRLECLPCEWSRLTEYGYTHEQIDRLVIMHETGQAP